MVEMSLRDEDDNSKKQPAIVGLFLVSGRLKPLSEAWRVRCSVRDRLVQIHIPVANLDVESAIGIAAHPSLVMYGSALASKVGQWQQLAISRATQTIGEISTFHEILLSPIFKARKV